MVSARKIGDFLLGPPEVSQFTKGAITLVCMTCSCVVGFFFQQHLIEKHYGGEVAVLHQRIKEIKLRELRELAMQGGGEAARDAVNLPRGETALIGLGDKLAGRSGSSPKS
jgi:hypothetical protein